MTTFYLGVPGDRGEAVKRALSRTTLGGFVTYADLNLEYADLPPFWSLDSSAFSVASGKAVIDLGRFAEDVQRLRERANPPRDVYALDVIGDWRASVRNYKALDARGVATIPTWHIGDPEELLIDLAKSYPKIAIGGVARSIGGKRRIAFFEQVFARIWPARVHGFGVMGQDVLAVPFHSVDAMSWIWPIKFRQWYAYGRDYLYTLPESKLDLMPEVRHFETLAAKAAAKWRYELAKLDPPKAP